MIRRSNLRHPDNARADLADPSAEQRHRGRLSKLPAQAAKNVLAITGGATSITGFISLITAQSFKHLIKAYPYAIYAARIITLLALLVTLNYVQILRRERARARIAAQRSMDRRASTHDLQFFEEMCTDLPLDGPVIRWLRRTTPADLMPTEVPADVLTALERTARRARLRPVGFDDGSVARALAEFLDAIEEYRSAVESWTLLLHNAAVRQTAAGVSAADIDPTASAIADSHNRLIRAYDSFIVTGHAGGMDCSQTS